MQEKSKPGQLVLFCYCVVRQATGKGEGERSWFPLMLLFYAVMSGVAIFRSGRGKEEGGSELLSRG